jgi:hypothetical protein
LRLADHRVGFGRTPASRREAAGLVARACEAPCALDW